ncbi:MAG: twin-arginine translocase TatA/TatE family subunit [Peptococcaceae bacterium]|jgi:sec-independent protein translocase protein TatA|nr:twin-arginine translocase TatA/TatE family subunit [Peptococcaceae bacterium]
MVTFGLVTATTAVVVLVIALVIFGPGKLPQLGKSLGKSITEFKAATTEKETEKEDKEEASKEDDA